MMIILYYSSFAKIACLAAQIHLGKCVSDDNHLLWGNFVCWGKDGNGNNVCSLTYQRKYHQVYSYALQGIETLFNIKIYYIDADKILCQSNKLKMWQIIIVAWEIPILYNKCLALVMNNLQCNIV